MTDTSDFEKMERDGWADPAIAKGYADAFENATRLVASHLASGVEAGPGAHVLDLCTGHGVVAAELISRGARVTGLDFSAAMVALAEAAVPDVTFVQGDAMAMTFADESFDAVTIGFGVPHFPDPAKGLAEAARVLKPGGRLAFSIWRGKGSEGSFGWMFDALGRLGDPSVALPAGPDAHMLVSAEVADPMVRQAGFRNIRLKDVASTFWVANPEDLFDAFDKGAVRAAVVLGSQSSDPRAAIRADLAKRVIEHGTKDRGGYLVAAPSVVISATRT